MWPKFGNGGVSMRNYDNLDFIMIWPEKPLFCRVALVQVEWFGTGTRYDLENLHQCGKKVKTKSQKVFGAISNVCRIYRGKTGGGAFLPPPWIGLQEY